MKRIFMITVLSLVAFSLFAAGDQESDQDKDDALSSYIDEYNSAVRNEEYSQALIEKGVELIQEGRSNNLSLRLMVLKLRYGYAREMYKETEKDTWLERINSDISPEAIALLEDPRFRNDISMNDKYSNFLEQLSQARHNEERRPSYLAWIIIAIVFGIVVACIGFYITHPFVILGGFIAGGLLGTWVYYSFLINLFHKTVIVIPEIPNVFF